MREALATEEGPGGEATEDREGHARCDREVSLIARSTESRSTDEIRASVRSQTRKTTTRKRTNP